MTYKECTEWLFNQLPMYQRVGQAAYKANLNNTLELDKYFNHPHKHFKTVHVAGTNGKGSVSHMTASILMKAGYKTGLYTSPHLLDFRERIKVDGLMISEDYVIKFVENNMDEFSKIQPSFFEMTVALAFQYFMDMGVDVAVIEVGMGGRLDSTNIINPEVSIISNIAYDHMAMLGNTLPQIAGEKAGIIKHNIPSVVGVKDSQYDFVFSQKASEEDSQLVFASEQWKVNIDGNGTFKCNSTTNSVAYDLQPQLKGLYQRKNIPTVLEAIKVLRNRGFNISDDDIKYGIEHTIDLTGLYGRWQCLNKSPFTICDIGHNPDGLSENIQQIKQTKFKKLHMIFGMVNDKDYNTVLGILPKDAHYYFCKASVPRALDSETLTKAANNHGLFGDTFSDVSSAYIAATKNADKDDMIYVGGSTFVVADILSFLKSNTKCG